MNRYTIWDWRLDALLAWLLASGATVSVVLADDYTGFWGWVLSIVAGIGMIWWAMSVTRRLRTCVTEDRA